jgi:hypothetical protein
MTMYIPTLRAYDAEKADNILALAHKSLVSQRKTMETPAFDGVPTEDQVGEIRFVVSRDVLTSHRASIEMDAFEVIDAYTAIDGIPKTPADLSGFWSEITPQVITPVLEAIVALHGGTPDGFGVGAFEPWTEGGLREMCLAMAAKLRQAQLDALDDMAFIEKMGFDVSRVALIGTTEWTGPVPVPTIGGEVIVEDSLDSTAVEKAKPGRPQNASSGPKAGQEVVSAIWTGFLNAMDVEVAKLAEELGISSPTLRNYRGGSRSKINEAQAKVIRRECEDRIEAFRSAIKLLTAAGF